MLNRSPKITRKNCRPGTVANGKINWISTRWCGRAVIAVGLNHVSVFRSVLVKNANLSRTMSVTAWQGHFTSMKQDNLWLFLDKFDAQSTYFALIPRLRRELQLSTFSLLDQFPPWWRRGSQNNRFCGDKAGFLLKHTVNLRRGKPLWACYGGSLWISVEVLLL